MLWCSVFELGVSKMGSTREVRQLRYIPATQTAAITARPPLLDSATAFDINEDATILDTGAIRVFVGS